jgi:spore coat protein U-like protein
MEEVRKMATRMSRLLAGVGISALVAGVAGVAQVQAATATASFGVSASVTANCTISAGALSFGTYDPVAANASAALDQSSTLTVACTKGTSAAVSLDAGTHASGAARRMQHSSTATEFLTYELYTSSARTTVWDTTNTVSYSAASKAASSLTVYGRVPSGQDVATGSYADTVVATITF